MNRILVYILFLLIIIPGCKKNTYIIPEDELVELLTDIHFTEGITNTNIREFLTNRERNEAVIRVIEANGYEKERFDSTMHYYALHSEKYEMLYDKVIQNLMIRESKVKAGAFDKNYIYKTRKILKEYPQDTVLSDSLLREFWWVDRFVEVDEETQWKGEYDIAFDDSLPRHGFVLKADIRMYPNDSSYNPRSVLMVSYLTDSLSGDSILTDTFPLIKDNSFQDCFLYLNTSDSLPVNQLKVLFLDHDSSNNRKHAAIENIRIYELTDPDDPAKTLPDAFLTR